MGIRFVRVCGIYDSVNDKFVEPAYLGLEPDEVKEYIKEHPFPKDESYSVDDFLYDLTTSGSWTLPDDIKKETGEYIAELIYDLIVG